MFLGFPPLIMSTNNISLSNPVDSGKDKMRPLINKSALKVVQLLQMEWLGDEGLARDLMIRRKNSTGTGALRAAERAYGSALSKLFEHLLHLPISLSGRLPPILLDVSPFQSLQRLLLFLTDSITFSDTFNLIYPLSLFLDVNEFLSLSLFLFLSEPFFLSLLPPISPNYMRIIPHGKWKKMSFFGMYSEKSLSRQRTGLLHVKQILFNSPI